MLLLLAEWFGKSLRGLLVFQYLTLRAILSVITALLITWCLGPMMIRRLRHYKIGETVREGIGLDHHVGKKGTPTMGGALILVSIAITTLLWGDLRNSYVWVVLLVTLGFGAIGAYDDFCKLTKRSNPSRRGIPARLKYLLQSLIALMASIFLYMHAQTLHETQLVIPFFKTAVVNLGLGYILLSYFVIVGTSNAVNLTDGLDGLAIMPAVLVAAGLGIFAYLTGNIKLADYLLIPYVNGVGEIIIFVGAIVGSGLGFLWFNTYPAEVFMGDIGSLALGAALGTMAVMVRQEIVLFIMGGIFVLETVSVVLQVGSFKMRGKRIFKMAPIHHHFELKGWPEPKIIVRFWIITFLLVMLGLATLKLR